MDQDEFGQLPPDTGTKGFGRSVFPMSAGETFRSLIELLGASHADVATILGIATQTVSLKCTGKRSVRVIEMSTLRDLWLIVKDGRGEDLPEGAPDSVRKRAEMIRSIDAGIL